MASTYSSNLGIELIGSGEQSGTWGTTTNNNLGTLLEQSICGYGAAAVTTGNTTTITMPNGASGTARNMVISVTGTGGASTVLAVPDSRTKIYTIFNGATGAITVRTVSGSGISVPTSTKAILYCDGTNVVDAVNYFSSLTLGAALPVASGGTGLATLTANNVILGNGTSNPTFVAPTTNGNILTANGTTWVSSAPVYQGTVTSVAMSVPTFLSVAGSPITASGTLAVTLSGTALPVANGGTGVTSTTAYAVYTGNSAGTGFTAIANGTTGQILQATTSGAPVWGSTYAGTVTSVAAITLGTTGTDLSSTVATGTTTPVITLQVPTASATNRGALSAADWTTFNNKGSGTITSVTGTAPVVSSGGTTPAISMAAATTSVDGYLTSTDWNTFNGKQAAGSYVTVGGALGTPSSGTLTNCTFPTLNQNTSGTAAGLSSTLVVSSGGTGSATATAYAVQCGGTTSTGAHQSVASVGTSGQVLTSNGASALPTFQTISSYAGTRGQSFTTGGTFTIPTGITTLKVTVQGGGGTGASGAGRGGSSGATAIVYLTGLTPGNTIGVTVAAAAGNSSIQSGTQAITTVTANGNGGSATNGTINISGAVGGFYSYDGSAYSGGTGGSSTFGGAGAGGNNNQVGYAATGYGSGGGGGGGYNCCGVVWSAGGSGAQGIVIFEY